MSSIHVTKKTRYEDLFNARYFYCFAVCFIYCYLDAEISGTVQLDGNRFRHQEKDYLFEVNIYGDFVIIRYYVLGYVG